MLNSNLGGPLLWAAIVTRRLELKTQRLTLRLGTTDDIPAILHYYQTNRAYLEPFEPQRPDRFYTRDFWQTVLASRATDFHTGYGVKLLILLQNEPDQVIGTINLNTIVRGALHGATLGYGLSAQHQGQGYMTEAGQRLIAYAFDELNLHRIMANYLPHNHRSANVLKRLGFAIEGMARDYLFINGQWQDHVMTSLVNPNWQMPEL
ncbi:GNAT family N-acetyltransferase [Nodosilinea sp. E11]|uniref:GNAT family N-acetyltransferase n=1 Tax=Nodosilinea sp. E11 TaxID=3037479 RepID=UPI002934D555|nr:GNAT family N-acetyltransferase [Nodosilinea sp. E11]WOD41591.1 GNAT family N-acetyltransferase [Nodosilinea sp. E11]